MYRSPWVTGTHDRHSLAAQSELLAALGSLRNFDPGFGTIKTGNLKLPAERCGRHGNRNLTEEIRTVPLEKFVRTDVQEDVQITGRSPA